MGRISCCRNNGRDNAQYLCRQRPVDKNRGLDQDARRPPCPRIAHHDDAAKPEWQLKNAPLGSRRTIEDRRCRTFLLFPGLRGCKIRVLAGRPFSVWVGKGGIRAVIDKT